MENKKVIIYFNQLSENPQADELDVLEQAEMVEDALQQLGYHVIRLPFSFDLLRAVGEIRKLKPDLIFNLVESIDNNGEFCYFAPAIFNHLQIPYSGVQLEAMFNTTNKMLAKELFVAKGIPTAAWFTLEELDLLDPDTRYILKPSWEEGSLGIDENSIFQGNDHDFVEKAKQLQRGRFFVEKLIEGREYNVAVLGGNKGPEVLPLAEMQFIDFPEDKPKIMGYTAKWKEDSFEYKNTRRTYEYEDEDIPLRNQLEVLALKCWNEFNMCGYIRVDIRVDKDNNPYVLEINTNPCLSENGGFYAASVKKGYSFKEVIERIVEDAF
jgi:D-alanine-D-alanine ligase